MFLWLEKLFAIKDDRLPINADVVIGIGIDVSKDGRSASPYSKSVAEKCLKLYKQDKIANVLLVGGYPVGLALNEAQAMRNCISRSVDVDSLFLEENSFRTYLNADYCLPIVQKHGWTKVIIVAQQWHARRVKATFKKRWAGTGIKIYVVKAWSDYGGGSQSRLDHFLSFAAWDTLSFILSYFKGWC
ncbi:MAG: YdcF family protein [Candidatus Kerfeldbacteria bacterium]|jgi:uncharacterized SAM-binding protein YcdF (DUF218 family)